MNADRLWEVLAEQSASRKAELNPGELRQELSFLVQRYQVEPAVQLPLGRYNIILGPSAIADLLPKVPTPWGIRTLSPHITFTLSIGTPSSSEAS
jgi:hypothetical protein